MPPLSVLLFLLLLLLFLFFYFLIYSLSNGVRVKQQVDAGTRERAEGGSGGRWALFKGDPAAADVCQVRNAVSAETSSHGLSTCSLFSCHMLVVCVG
jgi:hypothetical protein